MRAFVRGRLTTQAARAPRRTSLASAAGILMVSFVLSRLLGLLRLSIQASVLGGNGHIATSFTTAIAIPDTVFTIVSGGALGSSFIPVFAGLLEKGDEGRAWRVASGVMNGVLVVLLVTVVVAEFAAPWIIGPMTKPADHDLTVTLARIMLLQPLFLAVSGILMGLYNSYHRFLLPAVAPLVYNLANIGGLLLVPLIHHTVALAAWGVTIGALLQVVVMLPGLTLFKRHVRPGVGLDEPGTHEVGRLMLPRIVGQAGIQGTGLVVIALSNRFLAGDPSPSLRYAANLMALPVGIFGVAIATAAFPTMTGQAARGERAAMGDTISRTLRTMMFFAMPAGVALAVLRYPIIDVLLRRASFSAHATDLTAAALVGYGLGVPVWTAVEILPRAFFALKDTWTPVLVNLVTLATACVLSVAGVYLAHGDSILGVALLAGALSLTVLMEVLWLGLILRRRLTTLGLRELGLSVLRSLVASEAMGVALLALLFVWRRLGPSGGVGNALLLVIAVPLGAAAYVGWSYLLGAPELATARTMVLARLGRR